MSDRIGELVQDAQRYDWRDHLPKRKRRKCDVCGGAGVVLDGDVARPCPECGAR